MDRRVSAVVAACLVVASSACHSWARQDVTPQAAVADAKGHVRVTRTDHSVIELRDAVIVRDSLIGTPVDDRNARSAIALSDIQSVSTREVSAGKTAGLAAGTVLGIIAVLGILTAVVLGQVLSGG